MGLLGGLIALPEVLLPMKLSFMTALQPFMPALMYLKALTKHLVGL